MSNNNNENEYENFKEIFYLKIIKEKNNEIIELKQKILVK
jgi:hypothetical protein